MSNSNKVQDNSSKQTNIDTTDISRQSETQELEPDAHENLQKTPNKRIPRKSQSTTRAKTVPSEVATRSNETKDLTKSTPGHRVAGRKSVIRRASGETPNGKRRNRASEPTKEKANTTISVTNIIHSNNTSKGKRLNRFSEPSQPVVMTVQTTAKDLFLDCPPEIESSINTLSVQKEAKQFEEMNSSITSSEGTSIDEVLSSSLKLEDGEGDDEEEKMSSTESIGDEDALEDENDEEVNDDNSFEENSDIEESSKFSHTIRFPSKLSSEDEDSENKEEYEEHENSETVPISDEHDLSDGEEINEDIERTNKFSDISRQFEKEESLKEEMIKEDDGEFATEDEHEMSEKVNSDGPFTVHEISSEEDPLSGSSQSSASKKGLFRIFSGDESKGFSDSLKPNMHSINDTLSRTIENSEKDSLIASLNYKIQCLSDALINAEQDSLQYQNECEKARESARQMTSSLVSFNNRCKLLTTRLKKAETDLVEANKASDSYDDGIVRQLATEKTLDKETIAILKSDLEAQKQRANALEEKVIFLESELSDANDRIGILEANQKSVDKEDYSTKYSLVCIELEALKETHNNLVEELDTKKKMQHSLQVINETQTRQLAQKNELLEENLRKSAEKDNIIEILNSKVTELTETLRHIEDHKISENKDVFSSTISTKTKYSIGDRVGIQGKTYNGVIRFIGTTTFATGEWIGLELDCAEGKSAGTVNGHTYFTCKPKHALFLKENQIIPLKKGLKRQQSKLMPPSSIPRIGSKNELDHTQLIQSVSELTQAKIENEKAILMTKHELSTTQSNLVKVSSENKELNEKTVILEKKLEEKVNELNKLHKELEITKEEMKLLRETHISDSNTESEDGKAQRIATATKLHTLNSNLQRAQAEVNALSSVLKSVKQQIIQQFELLKSESCEETIGLLNESSDIAMSEQNQNAIALQNEAIKNALMPVVYLLGIETQTIENAEEH